MIKQLCFSLCFLPFVMFAQVEKQASWQQNVNYNIQVSLDDENHLLNGNIAFTYFNNSPDTLKEICMHLWPNAYKNNQTAFAKQQLNNNQTSFFFAKERRRGYIDSLNFMAGDDSLEMIKTPDLDIVYLKLSKPLHPGKNITINSPFRVKVPGSFSRLGHVKNSYQISQWYPKPAVYDVNGWNPMPYLDQGEFYSEFGDFKVSITLPQNYVVASTGVLQDSTEMKWLKERELYYKGNTKRVEDEVASSALLKTLHFEQNNIHDFAWFADKEFYVWSSKQMLPDSSAEIQTYLYSINENDKEALSYVNEGIEFYSEKVGNYPYAHASAVIGPLKAGGGMEYPMVTILSSSDQTTVVHEVGHNWFYGIIGTNERVYPWMDESINTYYENRYTQDKKNGSSEKNYLSKYGVMERIGDGLGLAYASSIARNSGQAVDLHSTDFTSANYGGIVYGKGAFIFGLLQKHLGDSTFDAAMQNFYQEWKYKHPLPEDFENSITSFTGDSLNWFFNQLLSTSLPYEYKVKRLKFKDLSQEELVAGAPNYQVLIKNKGKVAAPLQVVTLNEDGTMNRSRWIDGFQGSQWVNIPGTERLDTLKSENARKKEAKRVIKRMDKLHSVAINLQNSLPEENIHNNRIKTSGILKKMERIALGGGNHLDRRTTISAVPLANYNFYDNWMFGGAFHNMAHWERRFHFYAAGFYSSPENPIRYELFARQMFPLNLNWANRLDIFGTSAHFGHENNLIRSSGKRTSYFRNNIGTTLHFNNLKNPASRAKKVFTADYNIMQDENPIKTIDSRNIDPISYGRVLTASYRYNSNLKINPLNYSISFEQINIPEITILNPGLPAYNLQKFYGEVGKTFYFSKMKNYLKMRAFGGLIFSPNGVPSEIAYSSASGNGNNDYKYQRNLTARNEGFDQIPEGVLGARIIDPNFSGMRVPAWLPVKGTLLAANFEYRFAKKIPFNLYLDLTYAPEEMSGNQFNYVGGINMIVIKNVFEVSLPLAYSANIAGAIETAGIKDSRANSTNYNPFKHWHRLIVFKLNLNFDQDELINAIGL